MEESNMPGPILLAVDIDADATRLYDVLTTKAGQAAFWTSDLDIEPLVGSIARFGFPEAPVDLRMRIDTLTPGRLVGWTCLGDFPFWAGTTVGWELSAAPTGGTTVLLRQDGWPDDYPVLDYARVTYVWARILGALKAYVETGTPRPFLG
jgi:uncharacterized protein YndB with AHSA1/START domain